MAVDTLKRTTEAPPCSFNAEMYALADKYDIPSLMNKAAEYYYHKALGHFVWDDNDVDVMWGGDFSEEEDFEACKDATSLKRFVEFLESIPVVYRVPARADGSDLREIAVSYIYSYGPDMEILAQKEPQMRKLLDDVMNEVPEFAADVALRLLKKPTMLCEDCRNSDDRQFSVGRLYCSVFEKKSVYCRINNERHIPKEADS